MKKVVRGETYDDSDLESILLYAKTIEGRTLREALDIPQDLKPKGYTKPKVEGKQGNKGAMGDNVEEYFFDISNNNSQAPDFTTTQMELKTTGLIRRKDGQMHAKERLAITNINYMTILDETFENSHLREKTNRVLLMAYDYRDDTDNVFDMKFELASLWHIPEEDLPQIRKDWDTVIEKVRAGKAHEISGRDTLYLEAATTGSGHGVTVPQPNSSTRAKPRRWMLKSSYMTGVLRTLLEKKNKVEAIQRDADERQLTLEELIRSKFKNYFGKTASEILYDLNSTCSSKAKQAHASSTIAMLKAAFGIDRNATISEFEKAGLVSSTIRTVRVEKNGRIKESVSFPAFKWDTIMNTPWEESDFYKTLQRPFLFVVYRDNGDKQYRLDDVVLWTCPDDAVSEAQKVYEDTQRKVKRGVYDQFVRITGFDGTGSIFHVRTHGRDGKDMIPTPQGGMETRRSFWITNHYVTDHILKKEKETSR